MSRQFRSTDTSPWPYGFGDGHDGVVSVGATGDHSAANAGFATASSGATAITLDGASTFANGDLVLIHQTKGTGVGAWELNKIIAGGGGTSITLALPLQNTYTDSGANPGASQCQIVECKEYDTYTVQNTFTVRTPAWAGNVGGIMAIFAKNSITITGSISTQGRGFRAATEGKNSNGPAETDKGEGSGTDIFGTTEGRTANGNGAGGGGNSVGDGGGNGSGGGSGGSKTAGSSGYNVGYATAAGGNAEWTTNGVTLTLGGGPGGRIYGSSGDAGSVGSAGCGILFMWSKNITVTGTIQLDSANGDTSGDASTYSAGAGGAGSAILGAINITVGTNLITAIGGTAKGTSKKGGDGGIVLMYSGALSGTTNPAADAILDPTIHDPAGGGFILMMA